MLKKVIVPVAAFAITATSVSAFDLATLRSSDINLSEAQIAAFEEAESLRDEGASRDEIEAVLASAGIDEDMMRDIRDEAHTAMEAQREAMDAALAASDYAAFQAAVADSPFAEQIDTEAKFDRFVEAQSLMTEARAIMEELGIEQMRGGKGGRMGPGPHGEEETEE